MHIFAYLFSQLDTKLLSSFSKIRKSGKLQKIYKEKEEKEMRERESRKKARKHDWLRPEFHDCCKIFALRVKKLIEWHLIIFSVLFC